MPAELGPYILAIVGIVGAVVASYIQHRLSRTAEAERALQRREWEVADREVAWQRENAVRDHDARRACYLAFGQSIRKLEATIDEEWQKTPLSPIEVGGRFTIGLALLNVMAGAEDVDLLTSALPVSEAAFAAVSASIRFAKVRQELFDLAKVDAAGNALHVATNRFRALARADLGLPSLDSVRQKVTQELDQAH